jgi:hypothetical protein
MVMWLPPFWPKWPAVWFAQAESQFTLAGISSEQTKFCYVISQLDQRYASEVEDIFTCPTERDPYTTLRMELVRRLSPWKEHRNRELLTFEMGDRKPSQFLNPNSFTVIVWEMFWINNPFLLSAATLRQPLSASYESTKTSFITFLASLGSLSVIQQILTVIYRTSVLLNIWSTFPHPARVRVGAKAPVS